MDQNHNIYIYIFDTIIKNIIYINKKITFTIYYYKMPIANKDIAKMKQSNLLLKIQIVTMHE